MSKRIVRSVALMVGAGALVLGAAAPAMATEATPVTSLPANVKIVADGSVAVSVANSPVCAEGYVDFKSFSPGRQDAVVTVASCEGTTLTAAITPSATKKKNAVVKFTSMVNGAKVTQSMVVHVAKTRTPNPKKPANS